MAIRPSVMPLCVVMISLLLNSPLAADGDEEFNKGGRTAFQFTKIGIGARQTVLGSGSVAGVKDVNGVFWNPASVIGVDHLGVSFSYLQLYAGLTYMAGVGAFSIGQQNRVAISVATLDYGDLEEAVLGGVSADARTGNIFTGGDLLAGITFSRRFTDRLAIGLTAKYLSETLFEYSVARWAFDVGTYYETGFKGTRIGMSAQNVAAEPVYWLEESDRVEGYDIPLIYTIGLATDLVGPSGFLSLGAAHHLQVVGAAINSNDYGERFHIGGEYWFLNFLALRGGYRFNYAEGNLSVGAGVRAKLGGTSFHLDYTFTNYTYLESLHQFTVSFDL